MAAQPPPKYLDTGYERLPAEEEQDEVEAAEKHNKKATKDWSAAARDWHAEVSTEENDRNRARIDEQHWRRPMLRWLFGIIAGVLLVGALCRSAKKHSPYPRYHGEFTSLVKSRPSDFNDLFSGPGVVLDSFRFGADPDNVEQALEIPSASDILLLSDFELGFDVWRDSGRSVVTDVPKPVDEHGNVVASSMGHHNLPPDNLLLRPEPARIPHDYGTVHPPPVCIGPLKYAWQGPETFTVNLDEFEKFVLLVKSAYVGARIRVVDDPQSAQEGKVVVKPRIFLAEPDLNQVLDVSELTNSTRKAKALRIGTPSWDTTGNGKFNCIRAYLDVVFPPANGEPPDDSPVLQLFGAGTVRGEVDHGDAPSLGSLVGWTVHGRVHVKSATVSRCAALAVRDGAVKARLVSGSGDLRLFAVNGPIEAGFASTGQSSMVAVKGVNTMIRLHVSDEFSGKFRAATVNGVVKVSGEGVEFKKHRLNFVTGTHGSGNQTVHISTVNGPVRLLFGPMHHEHQKW